MKGTNLSVEVYGNVKNQNYDYAVLPWGATEPHNYHLPYITDCILAQSIAVDAVNKALERYDIRGMALPPIPCGSQNPGQRDLAFCLHYSYETQWNILKDTVRSLHHQGIRILVIVNGHGGNNFKNMVRDLAVDYPDFMVATSDWYDVEPATGYFEYRDDHAGEMETSVMMHYRPELVDMSLAGKGNSKGFKVDSLKGGTAWMPRHWTQVSEDSGIGNPEKSSPEKGKRFADVVSDKIAALFNDLVNNELYG